MSHLPNISSLSDKLPDIWSDNARLTVLYSPLRNETINPADWQSKLQFWSHIINIYCDNLKVFSFTTNDMVTAFKSNGRTPCCLEKVIHHMYKNNELCDLENFNKKAAETWSGWATDLFIKTPLSWSITKLQSTILKTEKKHTYIPVHIVQKHADLLYSEALRGEIYKIYEFHELLAIAKVNNEGLNVLLQSLFVKNKASLTEVKSENTSNKKIIIKLGNIEKVGKISDVEVNIFILQETEKKVTENMQILEEKISKVIDEAKDYLKKGFKESAKASLRKKRLYEKQLQKESSALFNMQELLLRLQSTIQDKEVLDAYKTALSSLKEVFNESELNVDNITETMLEIGEVLDIHDEVQDAFKSTSDTDDIDIAAELEALMSEKETSDDKPNSGNGNTSIDSIDEALRNLKLPDVPNNTPSMEAL